MCSLIFFHLQLLISISTFCPLILTYISIFFPSPSYLRFSSTHLLIYIYIIIYRAPGTVRGLTVRLLSNRFSPVAMQDELGIFFESQKEVFASLSQADLSNRAAALTLSLIDPPTSYAEEASEFWGAIVSGMPFDWTEQVVKELKELKVDAIQHAANEWLFNDEKRSSVSVMLFGNTHLEELKSLKSIKLATGKGFFPTLEESKICSTLEELTTQRNSLELFQDPSTSTI